MKINQLFKTKIHEEHANALAHAFGLASIRDTHSSFCKTDLKTRGTVEKIRSEHMSMLESYYLPCKARVYLHDLDEKKSITMFRQILRTFDLALRSTQKYTNNKKVSFYFINDDANDLGRVTKSTQANIRIEF